MAQPLTLPPLVRGHWLPMTSEEFDEWAPSNLKAEWVDGKGIIYVTNSERHTLVQILFVRLLATFLEVFDLGTLYQAPYEMRLFGGKSRRQPDLFIVKHGQQDLVQEYYVDGPADFVTEFVSKHNAQVDRVDKFREFAEAGVPEYLMIDTVELDREPEFYRRGDAGGFDRVQPDERGRYHSVVIPGFWFDPTWFRQDPLPDYQRLMRRIAPDAYRRYMMDVFEEEIEE